MNSINSLPSEGSNFLSTVLGSLFNPGVFTCLNRTSNQQNNQCEDTTVHHNKLASLSVGHGQPLFEKCPGDSNIKPGLRTTEATPPSFSFLIFVMGKIKPKSVRLW